MDKSVGTNQVGCADNSNLSNIQKLESNQRYDSPNISRPRSAISNHRKLVKNVLHSLSVKHAYPLGISNSCKQRIKKVFIEKEREIQNIIGTLRRYTPSQRETKKKFRAVNLEKYKKSQRILQKRMLKEQEMIKLSKKINQKNLDEIYEHKKYKALKNGAIIKLDNKKKMRKETQECQTDREKLLIDNINNIMNNKIQEIREKIQISKDIDKKIDFEFRQLLHQRKKF